LKVLVTGAGGTLGAYVVEHLVAEGHTVRAHDRVPPEASAVDDVVGGDLLDREHVGAVLAGVDAVVHAAAIPSPNRGSDTEIFRNNVNSTFTVLDTAGSVGVTRIVNISSASAVGLAWSRRELSPESVPVTEEHPYVGDDVYGLSKQIGELIALTASRRWGCSILSLRFPFIGTGERQRLHFDAIHADAGVDRAGLWGWIDTRDAARSIGAALTAEAEGHHVVNVAAPDTTSLIPTRELLRRYHPDTRVDRELSEFETLFDLGRARELLGFTAEHRWRDE
jgi:nucleoside-diphosphate-sugar epimerase